MHSKEGRSELISPLPSPSPSFPRSSGTPEPIAVRTLDLFCGCGGLSFGVSLAGGGNGFEVIAGLDFHAPSLATFSLNHQRAEGINADIRKVSVKDISKSLIKPDVIVGGPSCQGFSTHGNRFADDPRNFLYKNFMQFVKEINPMWVLMENVTGLLRYKNGEFKNNIVDDFQRLGYVVSFAQLQAADYGVPQTRKRVFFVANRLGIPFYFPRPTHFNPESKVEDLFRDGGLFGIPQLPFVTLEDAIGDLPWIGLGVDAHNAPSRYAAQPNSPIQQYARAANGILTLHYATPVPSENYERICHIPRGGDWLDIPAKLLPERMKNVLKKDATTLFYRLRWNRPGYTITTVYRNVSSGAFTHPDEDRALTHREAARIQSFPDHFYFNESNIGKQIGNAVPPILAKAIGDAILRHQKIYEKIGLKNINKFHEAVEEEEKNSRKLFIDNLSKSVIHTDHRNEILTPVSTDVLKNINKFLLSKNLELHSQMPLEVVLPLVKARLQGEPILGLVAGISNSSIIRLLEFWDRVGVKPAIKKLLLNDDPPSRINHTMKKQLNGNRPKRARAPRLNSHHFATVLYEVSMTTKCTTDNISLISTHE